MEEVSFQDKTRDGDTISFRTQESEFVDDQYQVYWYVCDIHLTFQCDTLEHSRQLYELLKTVKIVDAD